MLVASFAGIRRHVIMLNGTFPFFDIKGCSVSTDTIFSGTETGDKQENTTRHFFVAQKRSTSPTGTRRGLVVPDGPQSTLH